MRRSLLALVALAAGATLLPPVASAGQHRVYAVPKHPPAHALDRISARRTQMADKSSSALRVPRPPSNFSFDGTLFRRGIYDNGLVHPGFYRGFGRYGRVLPRANDTDVDVTTTLRQEGAQTVIVQPRARSAHSAPTVPQTEWRLRQSIAPDLRALGLAASGEGAGSEELRELIGAIVARRDRQWQERLSGARVVAVDEYQREIGEARAAVRKLEKRGRNPHILYLGFDD